MAKHITSWVVILGPIVVLGLDWLVFRFFGYEATITGVVRTWAEKSAWPEAVYLLGALVLYLHLYRKFL